MSNDQHGNAQPSPIARSTVKHSGALPDEPDLSEWIHFDDRRPVDGQIIEYRSLSSDHSWLGRWDERRGWVWNIERARSGQYSPLSTLADWRPAPWLTESEGPDLSVVAQVRQLLASDPSGSTLALVRLALLASRLDLTLDEILAMNSCQLLERLRAHLSGPDGEVSRG